MDYSNIIVPNCTWLVLFNHNESIISPQWKEYRKFLRNWVRSTPTNYCRLKRNVFNTSQWWYSNHTKKDGFKVHPEFTFKNSNRKVENFRNNIRSLVRKTEINPAPHKNTISKAIDKFHPTIAADKYCLGWKQIKHQMRRNLDNSWHQKE